MTPGMWAAVQLAAVLLGVLLWIMWKVWTTPIAEELYSGGWAAPKPPNNLKNINVGALDIKSGVVDPNSSAAKLARFMAPPPPRPSPNAWYCDMCLTWKTDGNKDDWAWVAGAFSICPECKPESVAGVLK
jgi:hypothetical protein